MVMGVSGREIMRVMGEAHEAGVKLEIHQGPQIWELLPSPLVTIEVKRIEASLRRSSPSSERGCHSFQDMAIRFPDGSIRRPDLAIYCVAPAPTQEAATSVPEAVVEVVSPGSEIKDLQLSPSFYLLHGVRDVLVFEPLTGSVAHFRHDSRRQLRSPAEVDLECGCMVTV